ncbi:hypothetical protein PACTADRAFT_46530 [Pachysolen tannophilus NRRL Y-2460]|uniref:ZIP zinc/iron transport family n=1 Tax=Pachysolen tannophilus NRRL Y-2460 TaxID=669874 RepID=A0A1E4TNJ3_PACTA|nr:hypothetical protein PACTADRAFT_46530 [Pachysolen tannophilus NRRL Y-2460]
MDPVQLIPRDACESGNDYNGNMGVRISAVFVIMATSAFGAFFPVLSSKYSFIRLPPLCFFVAKYFGSGVIVATAFIHLLQPANENLSEDCLGGTFAEYPWAFGIALMTLFTLFFSELLAYKYIENQTYNPDIENGAATAHTHSHFGDESLYVRHVQDDIETQATCDDDKQKQLKAMLPKHFSHAADHQNMEVLETPGADPEKEAYYGQLLNIFVLEFGIIFHSVFIGLTLAVSGDEFKTLYIVLVFHQCFEGLGLGTRIAQTPWPKSKKWTPWLMSAAYAITTPISIAIGLGVRTSYPPNSRRALITNGCFDSISAGILIYTGLVELMAHEFLFSDEFKGKANLKKMIFAYVILCTGAGLMALLGKWA